MKASNSKDFDVRKRHYLAEKELANKLKSSDRENRPDIYRTMYAELLKKVPEHGRLSESVSNEEMEVGLSRQECLIKPYISKETILLEFAPGTCRFAYKEAEKVAKVIAVDISDQRIEEENQQPKNLEHIIYDGYNLNVDKESIDLIFSNQFIEHIHPDDISLHLKLANSLLKTGGRYVFSTPHLYMGPWDISAGFSEVAEGFHLKEWTCSELDEVLRKAGFTNTMIKVWVKGSPVMVPWKGLYLLLEKMVGKIQYKFRKKLSRYLFTQIVFVAKK